MAMKTHGPWKTSSKITISGVDEDPYAPSQVSMISSPEEAGKETS